MNGNELSQMLIDYSMGLLDSDEIKTLLARLQSADDETKKMLRDWIDIIGRLAGDVDEQAAPPEVKSALMARIGQVEQLGEETVEDALGQLTILQNEGQWETLMPGIHAKRLHHDARSGSQTLLLRMMPGSRIPRHRHLGDEQAYMIEGSGLLAGVAYHAGDYMFSPAGSIHEPVTTREGCLMLILLPRIEFLE